MHHGVVVMINNKNGFTLIEFLVAIVILMVGLLGMLQSINVAMDTNLQNVFRTEAVTIVEDRMMQKRAKAFDSLTTGTKISNVQSNIRGIMKNYSVWETISQPTNNSKQISIDISWSKKKNRYTHSAASVVSTY